MEGRRNYQIEAEDIKRRCNQLKGAIDELEDLGVLINENLKKFQEDIQDSFYFCGGDYKFSWLIQGDVNAGKSTSINALLGERMLAVSSVPETNFITCVVYDRKYEVPLLYKTTLSKIYNSQTSNFHISEKDLEFFGVSGIENIESYLNKSNKEARKGVQEFEKQLQGGMEKEIDKEQLKENFYKDAKLDDTVYVIKYRIKSLEENIKDDFILDRVQLIDFPGMFEYGQNKITEIYKIFQDNTQGLIRIAHPSGYESNVITKLQNYEKYPNRLLLVVNKMDQIEFEKNNKNHNEKAEKLIKNMQSVLEGIAGEDPNHQPQQSRYLQMSKEVPKILHFMTGRDDILRIYLDKYKNSSQEQEKMLYNNILKSLTDDDQIYEAYIQESEESGKPFAEMRIFNSISNRKSNLLDKFKESLSEKAKFRLDELLYADYPKKVNQIRDELVEFVEKLIKEGSEERNAEAVHHFYKCDGCQKEPIVGMRYHCNVCADFDYCETCKEIKEHPQHEFSKIEKPSFVDYLREYCIKHSLAVIETFSEFCEKFSSQRKDLFMKLTNGLNLKKDQSYFKELLTLHCGFYKKTREEADEKFKKEKETFPAALLEIFSLFEKDQGPTSHIILLEILSLVAQTIKSTEKSLMLIYATVTNLLSSIMTSILGEENSASLVRELIQDVDLGALLLVNNFTPNNPKDIASQIPVWLEQYQIMELRVGVALVQLSQNVAEKIQQTLVRFTFLKILFEDEEKKKDLNEKLEKVLEKLKNIALLPVK